MSDYISRQDAIDLVRDVCDAIMSSCDSYYDPETGDEVYNDILEVDAILKCNKEIRIALAKLPSAEPEYEPVTAEDFAKTMSENGLYNFVTWHQEALTLMKEQGFVICKKTM